MPLKITKPIFLSNWVIFITFFVIVTEAQNPVKSHESVKIGGINQWIGAKGDDDTKPLLLFLHGGPGFSSKPYAKKFIKYLKKDFIVAQWDQRETGITAHWGPYKDTLTLSLFHQDTEEVVRYLLQRFGKKKLYLAGFSWGGFLGLHFANHHPELLHAYISVSGMIFNNESETVTLGLLKQKAQAQNNTAAQEEISKINIPFENWQELYFQRKWTAILLDNNGTKKAYPKSLFESWSEKWMSIFLEASKVNYQEKAKEIHCPIYFFISKNDYVANYKVAERYFQQLKADRKQLIWFDEASHEIPNQEPKAFSQALIKIAKQSDEESTK